MIRNEKGFTLIELMVVVLIIGILVAIAIPVFNGTANNAKNKACQANVRTIAGAAAQYQAENNGTWPATVGDLEPTYLKSIPTDPHNISGGATYNYTIDATTGVVDVGAGHPAGISSM